MNEKENKRRKKDLFFGFREKEGRTEN